MLNKKGCLALLLLVLTVVSAVTGSLNWYYDNAFTQTNKPDVKEPFAKGSHKSAPEGPLEGKESNTVVDDNLKKTMAKRQNEIDMGKTQSLQEEFMQPLSPMPLSNDSSSEFKNTLIGGSRDLEGFSGGCFAGV